MFKAGDRVEDRFGNEATVISEHVYLRVRWDDMPPASHIIGMWPADDFKAVTGFAPGDFVRIVSDDEFNGCVGMVYEVDCDDFWVALFDDEQSDEPFTANELTPWTPVVGDRVVEAGDEDYEEVGTVIGFRGDIVRVLWDDYPAAQDWRLAELEPADEGSDDEPEDDEPAPVVAAVAPDNDNEPESFNVNDLVEYHNPFFSSPIAARVHAIGEGRTFLKFASRTMPDGFYDNEFIQHAA